jgi:hypothetical protein
MKTPEEILEKHSPIFNPLFADANVRKWKANVVAAMDEYARAKWDQACEEQRKLCSSGYMAIDVYDHSNKFETIDREINAIKHAPKPEFKK